MGMTSSETMMNLDALLGVEEGTEETMGRTTVDASSSSSSSSVASVAERNSTERNSNSNSNSTAALWTLEDSSRGPILWRRTIPSAIGSARDLDGMSSGGVCDSC